MRFLSTQFACLIEHIPERTGDRYLAVLISVAAVTYGRHCVS